VTDEDEDDDVFDDEEEVDGVCFLTDEVRCDLALDVADFDDEEDDDDAV
jgi:hypothetical protein